MHGWTSERNARQAELIQTWRPWERSTGPKTTEGKSRNAMNAWRGGHGQKLRELSRAVNQEIRQTRDVIARRR